jgi:hypothetical protein
MTEFLADDNLSMNRVNPYTATDTFGVSTNGATYPDMQWKAPEDGPATWDASDSPPEFTEHYNPNVLNRSGAMYLKTGGVDPTTSFMFPARKVQYDDGTTSWSREVVWRNGENYTNENPFGRNESMFPLLMMLVLLLVLFVAAKVLKV